MNPFLIHLIQSLIAILLGLIDIFFFTVSFVYSVHRTIPKIEKQRNSRSLKKKQERLLVVALPASLFQLYIDLNELKRTTGISTWGTCRNIILLLEHVKNMYIFICSKE